MTSICYPDTATFVKATPSGYGNNKASQSQASVPIIFVQSVGFSRSSFQENVEADAICYPDPTNEFIVNNHMRLEGMYILAPLFGADSDDGWYKITRAAVNRDHLLNNKIDNIELALKKTRRIPGVS